MTPAEKGLLARAIQLTRVSYFTATERAVLADLMRRLTGYTVKPTARCRCGHPQTSHAGELNHGPCHGCDGCELFTYAGWMP